MAARKPIRFGFLFCDRVIDFEGGRVVPIPQFKTAEKAVRRRISQDGYYYPPEVKTVSCDMQGRPIRTIPKTKRPANLHPVPASHELQLIAPSHEDDLREGMAGFIVHFLALLFNTRLQFADWFFDGRVPMLSGSPLIHSHAAAGRDISSALKVWSNWANADRRRFTSILYMASRVSAYHWEWEKFAIEYMILDACWKTAQSVYKLRAKTHEDRVIVLFREFLPQMPQDFIDVKKLVSHRNKLFHEALWLDARSGSKGIELGEYSFPMRLRYVNRDLTLGLLRRGLA